MWNIPGPVILDLNTQRDLLGAEGAYPVFQADKLIEPLRTLFSFAHKQMMPVISTRLHHVVPPITSGGPSSQRNNGRPICTPNTPGYSKIPATTLRRRTEWQLDCETSLPVEGFRDTQQFVFDLPSLNLFECPRLDRLLSEMTAEIFVIVGAPLEHTVRTAVLGLLARRHKVAVVSDCLGMWDPYEGDMALRQIESKNILWLTAKEATEKFAPVTRRSLRADRTKARTAPAPAHKPVPNKTPRGAFRL
ncbi:MAG TPA: isochorismatase family protein [Phycisphaerae bacterium]|jgi:nicotinamidase-related amidase|nr:isochorismatase family protein [Phycisphaerae bacterium]